MSKRKLATNKPNRNKPVADPKSWESNFPEHQKTDENRLSFINRMAYISLAQYLLYRGFVPVSVYKRRRMEDVVFYCFDSSTRWGNKLSVMMKGMKEAITNKYLKKVFIMVNENEAEPDLATEVFSVTVCYDEEACFKITDSEGNCLISLGYKGEKYFRKQVRHIIKKLHAVTKALGKFKNETVPRLKLTYYDHTPEDYEPTGFMPCETTCHFAAQPKPEEFHIGSIVTNSTAIAFDIKSVYMNGAKMEDVMLENAGFPDSGSINPLDITADSGCGWASAEESEEMARAEEFVEEVAEPVEEVAEPMEEVAGQMEEMTMFTPRGPGRSKRAAESKLAKTSAAMRLVMKSPTDLGEYPN